MNGIEKKQLQIDRGTRVLVENIDEIRCKYGFDKIIVQTPIVETKLRSGLIPARPFIFSCEIPSNEESLKLQVTVPIEFPKKQLSFVILDSNENGVEEYKFLEEAVTADSVMSISQFMERIMEAIMERQQPRGGDLSAVSSSSLSNVGLTSQEGSSETLITDDHITEGMNLEAVEFYCCKYCRFCLSDSSELHEHSRKALSSSNMSSLCTSVYLENPPSFLHLPVISANDENTNCIDEGRLFCPKCEAKVGNWSWVGSKCSCGEWIVPSFQLIKSKIDVKHY
jgi:hypothetical protein